MDKEYETYSIKKQYIIMKDGLFFDGCSRYGVDKELVLRVAKSKWNTGLRPIHLKTLDEANRVLEGILKYDCENGATYKIVEVKKKVLIEKVDW